ncbi:collagen alpha-1(III) chain-like [Oenanthe melanoleuca]|uniref:collagen alpha-1(III) chain-like n=1 Tax=Oenanthe melanoleuca TaxID=2939378 RepID=UPI0024C135F1|nr:collagen alpha-1(III) chain-like [Oenanthe melanoleuca]
MRMKRTRGYGEEGEDGSEGVMGRMRIKGMLRDEEEDGGDRDEGDKRDDGKDGLWDEDDEDGERDKGDGDINANAVPTIQMPTEGLLPARAAHRGAPCSVSHLGTPGVSLAVAGGGLYRGGHAGTRQGQTAHKLLPPVPAGAGPPCQPSRGHYGSVRQLRPPDPPVPGDGRGAWAPCHRPGTGAELRKGEQGPLLTPSTSHHPRTQCGDVGQGSVGQGVNAGGKHDPHGAATGGDTTGQTQVGTLPGRAKALPAPQPSGLRAELPAVPHSGEAASAGGRCQQALAGSELRSDSRHRCPCFNSSAMEPGRPGGGGGGSAAPGAAGIVASPARPGRGSGDRRDPPLPHGAPMGASWAPHGTKTGTAPHMVAPTSLPVPHIPPDPRAAPGPRSGAASAARRAPGAGSLRFFMPSCVRPSRLREVPSVLAELRCPRCGRAGSWQLPRPPNPPELNLVTRDTSRTRRFPASRFPPREPGGRAGHRSGHRSCEPGRAPQPKPRLCFGAGHQDRAPKPCTEEGQRSFATKPFTGTVQQNLAAELCTGAALRSFAPGPCSECGAALRGRALPEQPAAFPHLRRGLAGTGETKIPKIERKPRLRQRDRHPLASPAPGADVGGPPAAPGPRVPLLPRGATRPWPPLLRAAAPVPPVAGGGIASLGPTEPPSCPTGCSRLFPGVFPQRNESREDVAARAVGRGSAVLRRAASAGPDRGVRGRCSGSWGRGGSAPSPGPAPRRRWLWDGAQHVGAALNPAPVCPTLNRPGLSPKAAGLRGAEIGRRSGEKTGGSVPAAPVRPRRTMVPRGTDDDREPSARPCPVPGPARCRRPSDGDELRCTAAADSSGHGHRAAAPGTESGTGLGYRHRIGGPAAAMGTGSLNRRRSLRGSNERQRREPAQTSPLAPALAPGTEPRLQGEAAPGTGTSSGHRAWNRPRSPALATATAYPSRGTGGAARCQRRAPSSRGIAAVSPPLDRAGPPLRIPVPLLVRGGHRLPGPGGDTRGAEPRYISAAAPRAAHSGGGSGGGTAGGGQGEGGVRPGAPGAPGAEGKRRRRRSQH